MLRRTILMLTLAAIAVLVVAPAAESKSVTCHGPMLESRHRRGDPISLTTALGAHVGK